MARWFTEQSSNKIGRITTAGIITEFNIPSPQSNPQIIVAGSDGAMWFAEFNQNKIGRISLSGNITEFSVPSPQSEPQFISSGPDGALWFTEFQQNKIGRITTAGVITEFTVPTPQSGPAGIVAGPDGALWFTEFQQNKIGRITTAGVFSEFNVPSPQSGPVVITTGPDAALWFTERQQNKIGRISVTGVFSEFTVTSPQSSPDGIVTGPDGLLWFTELQQSQIGRLTPPANSSPLLASTLPSSRSVKVGAVATAFATILNTGSSAATVCSISPITQVPANFQYQTTNPSTNALAGAPNTPANIAGGGAQSFVIAFTANGPLPSTNVSLGYSCSATAPVVPVIGLNTILLTFDPNGVPDIIALAATLGGNGIVNIPGLTGVTAFAVATANIGVGAAITVSADSGLAALAETVTLCLSNPTTGACAAPPASTVTTIVNANDTPTFSIFVAGSGNVPFDPANNRIFVRFKDASGITRGSTSVAVRTQ